MMVTEESFAQSGYPKDRHGPQDFQSLIMHREAVRMVIDNPDLETRLLQTLDRWSQTIDRSTITLLADWYDIIRDRQWDRALAITERGNQIRQASPMATLLPNHVRLDIIRQMRKLKDSWSCDAKS